MNKENIQPKKSIKAVAFDCDCTLSFIEGIEKLGCENGVHERIVELTRYAMSEVGLSPDIYTERLELVRPNRAQVIALAQAYYAARTPKIVEVIEALHSLGKAVYVVSAGVNPAVKLFAAMLEVPVEHVYAVDLEFDELGEYVGYDVSAYPAQNSGKRIVADFIKAKHDTLAWVGDGMNDLVVKPDVERFIGYGGAAYREKVAASSNYYICCQSMAPVLALTLTSAEADSLDEPYRKLYEEGCQIILKNEVEVR